jgi:hypothetical protein
MKQPKKTTGEIRREVLQLLQTEGIRAAAMAAIAVCNDPNAPPNARATAAGLIFRGAALGGFGKGNEVEDDDSKGEHEMTVAEIDRRLARLQRDEDLHDDPDADDENHEEDGDAFS